MLTQLNYIPLLITRPAEVVAIRELAISVKQSFLPAFRMHPLGNAKELSRTTSNIADAMQECSFILDIDDWWQGSSADRPAIHQFNAIIADASGTAWYDFVVQTPQAIPSIRLTGHIDDMLALSEREESYERGFAIILSPKNVSHFDKLLDFVSRCSNDKYCVVLDAGWNDDPLLQVASMESRIGLLLEKDPELQVFAGATSFPYNFDDIGMEDEIELTEQDMFQQLSDRVRLKYNTVIGFCDWATTRPPMEGPAYGWVPRIDLADLHTVISYRSRPEEGESKQDAYNRIASDIVSSSDWPSVPPTWGHYCISLTADGSSYGISEPRRSSACRINMYLHQRGGGSMSIATDLEEVFVD